MIRYQDPKQEYRNRVWGELLVSDRDAYKAAKATEIEINALIDQGSEAGMDEKSVADIIISAKE